MFSLQSPIKPRSRGAGQGIILITQMFGGNDLDYSTLGLVGHNGLDFQTLHFQDGLADVLASHSGTIISDRDTQSDTAGRFVKILSEPTEIDGKNYKIMTIYFHLSKCLRKLGDKVKAGEKIGVAGNTGSFTNGPHLHFGLYLLSEENQWQEEQNEYGGATDPLPHLTDDHIYQYGDSLYGRQFFYKGKAITREDVDEIIEKKSKNNT